VTTESDRPAEQESELPDVAVPTPRPPSPEAPPRLSVGHLLLSTACYATYLSAVRSLWQAAGDPADTRLEPDRPVRVRFAFPPATAQVRVRLIYRRFWDQVARDKGWPDNDDVVFDRTDRAP